jgi:hypothetical protein
LCALKALTNTASELKDGLSENLKISIELTYVTFEIGCPWNVHKRSFRDRIAYFDIGHGGKERKVDPAVPAKSRQLLGSTTTTSQRFVAKGKISSYHIASLC